MRTILLIACAMHFLHLFGIAQQPVDKIKLRTPHTILMLQKKNKNKNVYYEIGDVISFQLKDRKSKITATITGLRDSVIVFNGFEANIATIRCLYIDEKTRWWLRYKIAQLSLITGGGYVVLDALNTGKLDSHTVAVSGTIVGVGVVAKLLISNKIKMNRRTKLRILQF
jgi:hypothetical protein